MERSAANRERTFAGLPREEMESLWDAVKRGEKKPSGPALGNEKSASRRNRLFVGNWLSVQHEAQPFA